MKAQKMVFLLGTVYSIPPSVSRGGQLPAGTQGSAALVRGLRRQWRQDGLRGAAQKHQEEARETDASGLLACFLTYYLASELWLVS